MPLNHLAGGGEDNSENESEMFEEEPDSEEELRKKEDERRKQFEAIKQKHAAQAKEAPQPIEESKSPPLKESAPSHQQVNDKIGLHPQNVADGE